VRAFASCSKKELSAIVKLTGVELSSKQEWKFYSKCLMDAFRNQAEKYYSHNSFLPFLCFYRYNLSAYTQRTQLKRFSKSLTPCLFGQFAYSLDMVMHNPGKAHAINQ